jgi:hypothetical protein
LLDVPLPTIVIEQSATSIRLAVEEWGKGGDGSYTAVGYFGSTQDFLNGIDVAASNAQQELVELRVTLSNVQNGAEALDAGKILSSVRHYFWELETALRIALLAATRHQGFYSRQLHVSAASASVMGEGYWLQIHSPNGRA